jgi:hypothetical protein
MLQIYESKYGMKKTAQEVSFLKYFSQGLLLVLMGTLFGLYRHENIFYWVIIGLILAVCWAYLAVSMDKARRPGRVIFNGNGFAWQSVGAMETMPSLEAYFPRSMAAPQVGYAHLTVVYQDRFLVFEFEDWPDYIEIMNWFFEAERRVHSES